MKTSVIGIAATAALSLFGLPSHANCAYLGSEHQEPIPFHVHHSMDHEGIVGTWHVSYGPVGEAFIQWHSDGTEWENINHPVLGGNICMGSWKAVDRSHVFRNHYGWLFNNGVIAGFFNETETDELMGNAYVGVNNTTLYFYPVPPATEGTTVELKGTARGIRIAP